MSSRDIANLKQGLVAAWIPSLGSTGYRLVDRVGSNHGVLTNMDAGSDWVVSGGAGALDFDGSNDYVDLGNKQSTAFTNTPMSVTAWVVARTLTSYKRVLHREVHFLFGTYNNELLLALGNGSAWNNLATFGNAITLNTNQLYFIAATYNGSTATGYINGKVVGTTTGAMVYNPNRNLELGSADLPISTQWWDGAIDDIRIYNRALSAAEISLLSKERGIGFKTSSRTSSHFAKRYSYKPPKDKTYAAITRSQSDYDSLREGLVLAICPSITQGSGYRAPDLSGRGNHGTVTNADLSTFWKADGGVSANFDGSDDYVDNSPWTAKLGTGNFSVAAWVKTSSATRQAILGAYDGDPPDQGIIFDVLNTGKVRCSAIGPNSATNLIFSDGNTSVNTGEWVHVCGVRNGSAMAIYVAGKLDTASSTSLGNSNVSITGSHRIGLTRSDAGYSAPFSGQIDDVRVYSRALTTSEVAQLASRRGIGLQPTPRHTDYIETREKTYSVIVKSQSEHDSLREGLVGAWCPSVTGATGFRLIDKSGYGNHGTLTNMTSEDWVSSNGLALDFDGTDDYITVGNKSQLNFGTGNFSLSFWVKTTSNTRRSICNKFNYTGVAADEQGFYVDVQANGTLRTSIETPSGAQVGYRVRDSVATINNGAWRHVAIVRNGTNVFLDLYIDGLLSNGSTLTFGDVASISTTADFEIAREWDELSQGNTGFFVGSVDDFRAYNRSLTAPEIRLLASKRGIGLAPRPRHYTYYQFPSASRRRKLITGMP